MVEAPYRYPNLVRGELSAILTGCARYLPRLPKGGWKPGRRSCPSIGSTSPPRYARWYYPARPGAFPMPTAVTLSTGAMNRASEAVTVHAYGDRPRDRGQWCKRSSHALLPPRHCTCGAGSCRAPYPGWHCGCGAASFQPPSPAAVPGGPDKDHASKAVMVFASCPALSRLPCGTRTASTLAAGLCAGSS